MKRPRYVPEDAALLAARAEEEERYHRNRARLRESLREDAIRFRLAQYFAAYRQAA